MQEITWYLIYWYASIGLLVGFIFGVIIRDEGVSIEANIFWGVVGAVMMGVIGFMSNIGDGVFFSFWATWAFLFLINVFHQHHKEDIFGEIEHQARVDYHSKSKTHKAR
jgi:hypothetical protein